MNAIIESLNAWGARFAGFAIPMLMQSAVLIGLLFALDLLLRKRVRATIRYAVWMLLLVKLALPPSLTLPTAAAYWLPAQTAGTYSTPAVRPDVALLESMANSAYKSAGTVQVAFPPVTRLPKLAWQAAFLVVWLAVASGVGFWVVWRLRLVVGLIRQSAEASAAVRALAESCRRQLGIRRVIPVRCAAIGSPAICGALRPVILIPPELEKNLQGAEMRSVLLHELAHYKRGDLWVNHAQILLQIVYWYNPLVWLANASIRRAREQAVDEMVLVEMGVEAPSYPATLLHVAKLGLGRPLSALGLVGILEPGRGLTQRILHIMNRPLPRTARIGARGLAAVLLLALVALPMACRRNTAPPSDWSGQQFKLRPGRTLAPTALAELEAKLVADPEDFSARTDLLDYYFCSGSDREALKRHILWIIANHPEFSAGGPCLKLHEAMDGSAYGEAKALWLKAVQDNPKNALALGSAASYFTLSDQKTAEDMLRKAQVLEPQNPEWSEQLGQLYKLECMGLSGTDSKAKAQQALAEFEKAQTQTSPGVPGAPRLVDLAQMAVAAGDLEKARTNANELLGPGMLWSGGGNAERALFYGNIVLGRIALREGKLGEANKFLLEAGKTKGDPVLSSSGPNMSLAKELLEKGETNSVLEFFQECRKFWTYTTGPKQLGTWTAEVKDGKTPDFGANLYY